MKRLIVSLAALTLFACGTAVDSNGDGIADGDPRSPDSVTAVAPSSPKGKVSGRVLDSEGKPLAGVQVLMSGTEAKTAATDANGLFAIDGVTGGSRVGLVFTLAGYAPAWANVTVPGSTGNFPLNDGEAFVGPIGMMPVDGSLTFHVVGWDGALVAAPQGLLDVTPGHLEFNSYGANGVGSITTEVTGADGVLTFTGVPKLEDAARLASVGITARYSLYVPPVVDGETLRYAGRTVSLSAQALLSQPGTRTIVLDPPGALDEIEIEATNVTNLFDCPSLGSGNLVPAAGPLYVVFNQRISPTALAQIWIDQQDGSKYEPIAASTEVISVGNQLRIVPGPGLESFQEGHKYFLSLQVTSRDNPEAAPFKVVAPFFGGVATDPKPLGNVTVQFLDDISQGTWNVGENLEIVFERNVGGAEAAGFSVPVYFDADLDKNNEIGNATGELGSDQPFCVRSAETVPPIAGAQSAGYARWASATVVSGPQPSGSEQVGIAATGLSGADQIKVTLAFSESYKCSGAVQTVWGENLVTDVEVNLMPKSVAAP